jgi:hypothetical protein
LLVLLFHNAPIDRATRDELNSPSNDAGSLTLKFLAITDEGLNPSRYLRGNVG